MIELAKRRGLFVAQASAFSLPFPKDSFDLVLCIEMVECVDESRDVVKELVRVAKPGASVILSAVSRSLLRLLRDVGRKRKRRLVAQEEILSIYEELGLKDIEMMEMYYYPRFTRVSKRITALSKLFSASFAIKGVKQ
jgi:2-polyprenyl-3-methyl-5-hydroxy-6-metoxy-1,4-benzoquinol methylase